VIVLAVRWCLRFGLSYRDLGDLPAESCVPVCRKQPTGTGARW